MTGYILAGFGYEAGVAQSAGALQGVRLLVSFIPAIGSVAAMLLPLFYSLDDSRMKMIEADLKARRATAQPSA